MHQLIYLNFISSRSCLPDASYRWLVSFSIVTKRSTVFLYMKHKLACLSYNILRWTQYMPYGIFFDNQV